MEQKIKTVNLSKDNSKKIIILLSIVIVILLSSVAFVLINKKPVQKTNATLTQTQSSTRTEKYSKADKITAAATTMATTLNIQQISQQEAMRHQVTTTTAPKTDDGTVKDKEKTIYLTFDDGPSSYTPEILDILDKYNVKATFFVINTNYNKYMKNIVDRGHTIALHSYTHDYKKIYASEDAYYKDLQLISDTVYKETGVRTKIIRFPGGGSNTISRNHCKGIMSKITKGVEEKGYHYFDWNVSSGDADGNNVPVQKLIDQCKKVPKYSNTIVVLMHDTKAKHTTVDALPTIIENYKAMGYKFSAITDKTPPVHHKVNN